MCCFLLVLLGFVLQIQQIEHLLFESFLTQPRNVRKKVISVISRSNRYSIMPFQTTVSVLVHLVLPLLFYHKRYVKIHAGEVHDAFKWLSIAITKPRWRLRSEKGQSYCSCWSLRIFHSRLSSASPQELPVNVSTAMLQQGYKLIDRIPSFHITASTDVGGLAYMLLDERR